jgi:protein involved in polysaccharide export with SLBB domain
MADIRKLGKLIGWFTLLAAGCSAVPGRGLTLFPEGHKLIDSAKAMRSTYPTALPLPKELDKRPLPPYTVEPGDVLLVQAADLDSPLRLPGDQPVMPDGTITLGRHGRLQVAGRTVEEIEAAVRPFIEAQARDPKEKDVGPIVVRVVTRLSKVYYVLGEVNAPGAFTMNGRETVLDGILAAGGLTERASRREIILSRPTRPDGCRVVLPICYREIVQLGDTSTNYQLLPGDRIFVATRSFWEELFHNKPDCAPCGGPQHACPNGTCSQEGAPVGKPVVAPVEMLPPR